MINHSLRQPVHFLQRQLSCTRKGSGRADGMQEGEICGICRDGRHRHGPSAGIPCAGATASSGPGFSPPLRCDGLDVLRLRRHIHRVRGRPIRMRTPDRLFSAPTPGRRQGPDTTPTPESDQGPSPSRPCNSPDGPAPLATVAFSIPQSFQSLSSDLGRAQSQLPPASFARAHLPNVPSRGRRPDGHQKSKCTSPNFSLSKAESLR